MIKCQELRIGNWVIYKPYGNQDGTPENIAGMLGMKAYFDKHSNRSGMFHYLQGIPLTLEIMGKCAILKDGVFPDLEYFSMIDGSLYFNGEYTATDVKYLHQLQNLYFALTGNELEVNL